MGNLKQSIYLTIRGNRILSKILQPVKAILKRRLEKQVRRHPLRRFDKQHQIYYGKKLDIRNPRTMYEKICFIEFCSDTALLTRCTDKVAVRDYLKELGFGQYLNPVYKIFEDTPTVEQLDEAIPERCVVKTANSGGGESVFIVRDKDSDTAKKIYPGLLRAIADDYGRRTGQPHYIGIRPRVIIEKLIVNEQFPDLPPNDYKLFCINGEPVFFNAIADRNLETHEILDQFFDLDWQPLGEDTVSSHRKIACPRNLEKMLSVARQLARPFPFVRVDFYETGSELIFGELTFTPGFDNFIGRYGEDVLHLGERLDISKVKCIREPQPDWY